MDLFSGILYLMTAYSTMAARYVRTKYWNMQSMDERAIVRVGLFHV